MQPTARRPAKAACRKDSKPLDIPERASRAPYVFAVYRETARALEAAAFSVPRPNRDRAALVRACETLKDGIQSARLETIQAAAAACENIPLARRRFPCPLAWTRFLARIAPEQSTLAV